MPSIGQFLSMAIPVSTLMCNAIASDSPSFLSATEVKALLPCAPPLISRHIDETGFASEIRTVYGSYDFLRTDVGDPDGHLTVSKNGKKICETDLGLNPEIYFSGKLQLMVISAYSGSNDWFVFYDLKADSCRRVGETNGRENYILVRKLLDSHGGRRCRQS